MQYETTSNSPTGEAGNLKPNTNIPSKTDSRPGQNVSPVRPGRNDLCHCGSDLKYKKCCLDREVLSDGDRTYKDLSYAQLWEQIVRDDRLVGKVASSDYDTKNVFTTDALRKHVGGVPRGCLLAGADPKSPENITLVRAQNNAPVPLANETALVTLEITKSLGGDESPGILPDPYTQHSMQVKAVICRVIGTLSEGPDGKPVFSADVADIGSATGEAVYKPAGRALGYLINQAKVGSSRVSLAAPRRVGQLWYADSQPEGTMTDVDVYLRSEDTIRSRTGIVGQTGSGKTNMMQHIIANERLFGNAHGPVANRPVNQLVQVVIDQSGELTHRGDNRTRLSMSDIFKNVQKYSAVPQVGYREMKYNFYHDLETGFELICSELRSKEGGKPIEYVSRFRACELGIPEDPDEGDYYSRKVRAERNRAFYQAGLFKAGFREPQNYKVKFPSNKELDERIGLYPSRGITLGELCEYMHWLEKNSDDQFFVKYEESHGKPYLDETGLALLEMFSQNSQKQGHILGYKRLREFVKYHSAHNEMAFDTSIAQELRKDALVQIDVSGTTEERKKALVECVLETVYETLVNRYKENRDDHNYTQIYIEEAQHFMPVKNGEETIFSKIAREGRKYNLGLIYGTQTPSVIAPEIRGETENLVVTRFNNVKEARTLAAYDDFEDFLPRLTRPTPIGLVLIKQKSCPFVFQAQIDKFEVPERSTIDGI